MEVVYDFNTSDRNESNPIYTLLPKVDKIVHKSSIHRIPGHRINQDIEDLEENFEEDAFDYQGMMIENQKLIIENITDTRLEVYGSARHFGIVFPGSYLRPDAVSFYDINIGSGNIPDAFAADTMALIQILFYLFSEEGIHFMWAGMTEKEKKEWMKTAKLEAMAAKMAQQMKDNEAEEEEEEEEDEVGKRVNLFQQVREGVALLRDENVPVEFLQSLYGTLQEKPAKKQKVETKVTIPEPPVEPLFSISSASRRNGVMNSLQFTISERLYNDENMLCFPRVCIDLITVQKNKTITKKRINTKKFRLDNVLVNNDIECWFFHFSILDPMINVSKGVQRLINFNRAEKLRLEKNKKKTTETKVDFRYDDTSEFAWDLKCINQALELVEVRSYIRMLGVVTSQPVKLLEQFESDANQVDWTGVTSKFNIVTLLSTRNDVDGYLWGAEGQFRYSVINRVYKDTITDEEFLMLPQMNWEQQFMRTVGVNDKGVQTYPERSLLVYYSPNQVIRFSVHHIDPYLIGATFIPSYMNSDRQSFLMSFKNGLSPTANMVFPTLVEGFSSNLKHQLLFLKRQLKAKSASLVLNSSCSADVIRSDIFDTDVDKVNIKIPKLKDGETVEDLRNTAYKLVLRTMNSRSNTLSASMKSMTRYVDQQLMKDPYFSIYPDIYNAQYGFKYYDGYTMFSNFLINANVIYIEQTLSIRHVHRHIWRAFTESLYPAFHRFGMQPTVAFFGDTGSSKSTIFKVFEEFSVPGLTRRCDSSSRQARNTWTSHVGMTNIMDESDGSAPFVALNGKESEISADWKTQRTSGKSTRDVTTTSKTERRVTVTTQSDQRTYDMWGGNLTILNIPPSARNRVTFLTVDVSNRASSVKRLEFIKESTDAVMLMKNINNFENIIRGMQVFCFYVGYLARAGAIEYNSKDVFRYSNILNERFKPILNNVLGLNADSVFDCRFDSDRLPIMVECVMLQRVYASICSGCIPLIKPGEAFSVDKIKELAKTGIFLVSEDDYVMGLSYFEQMFRFEELHCFLKFCKEKFHKLSKRGENLGYTVGSHSLTWFDYAFHTPMDQHYTNYNYLDLAKIFQLPANEQASDKEVLRKISDQVYKVYNHINPILLADLLTALSKTDISYTVCRYMNTETCKGVVIEHGQTETSKILVQTNCKSDSGFKILTSFVLNRQWFDKMVSNKLGTINRPGSYTDSSYLGGVIETALQFLNYDGSTPRKVILPGMTLDKINFDKKPYTDVFEMPHVFKTLELGKKIISKPEVPQVTTIRQGGFNSPDLYIEKEEYHEDNTPSLEDYNLVGASKYLTYLATDPKTNDLVPRSFSSKNPGDPFADLSSEYMVDNLKREERRVLGELFDENEFKNKVKQTKVIQHYSPLGIERNFKKGKENINPPINYYKDSIEREKKFAHVLSSNKDDLYHVDLSQYE